MPKLYIISGCNGSGKTTASYTLLPEMLECNQFVNSDEFAKSLSPFNPSEASVSASRYMLQKIYYLLGNHMDFCVETTLATRSLMGIINDAKSRGYTVDILYFWLKSPEMAIARVKSRVEAGGHNIPENVVPLLHGAELLFRDLRPGMRPLDACRQFFQPLLNCSRGLPRRNQSEGQGKIRHHPAPCLSR